MVNKKSKNKKNQKIKNKVVVEKEISEKINLKSETVHWVVAIIFFVLAVFLILASINKGGVVGNNTYGGLSYLLGIGYFLLPTLFLILSISYTREVKTNFTNIRIFGSFLFVISGLGIINSISNGEGGVVGNLISSPLIKFFDFSASLIFLSAMMLISLIIIFDTKPSLSSLLFWRKDIDENLDEEEGEEEEIKIKEEPPEEKEEGPKKEKSALAGILNFGKKEEESLSKDMEALAKKKFFDKKKVTIPLSLLEKDRGKPGVGDIKANANIIKRALQNFGINVEMDEISIGPSVTRYALKPAEGVKLSRIVGLQNDLSLALAAHPLRIEAPIPGKALVGIEIPNTTKTTVGLGTLFLANAFTDTVYPLNIALGKDISGNAHFANLAKAPHMLIAGSTGSGKSVTIHTLLVSLLYRNGPEELRFIMIDPKRVELTLYKNIPHLLTPVITDPKKAILALKWAIKEMERRYELLEEKSVRDIQSYHKTILEPARKQLASKKNIDGSEEVPEAMPYIVVVIDELADIMQSYPRELESSIVRLAQMSRAVGIHLILSTQRPSVNVITGLIKANIPTRLALQVASQVDSRTILDMSGAEKLLGAGDMLYLSGEMSKPRRIQAAYISENEVKNVVKFLKNAYADEIPDEIDISIAGQDKNSLYEGILESEGLEDDSEDDLYETAKEEVINAKKASTSYIQRKMRIGYARAARLMDMLEDRGVIGPADGSRAREILVKSSEPNNVSQSSGDDDEYLNEDKDVELMKKIKRENGMSDDDF